MNKSTNNQLPERRVTRTFLHTVHDQRLWELNYIDNYYSKRGKKFISVSTNENANQKNDGTRDKLFEDPQIIRSQKEEAFLPDNKGIEHSISEMNHNSSIQFLRKKLTKQLYHSGNLEDITNSKGKKKRKRAKRWYPKRKKESKVECIYKKQGLSLVREAKEPECVMAFNKAQNMRGEVKQVHLSELLKTNFHSSQYAYLKELLSVLNDHHSDNRSVNDSSLHHIPNCFEKSLRTEYAKSLNFVRIFYNDYLPIEMQKESSTWKTPPKSKSSPQIKRRCGVSYVVSSESRQLNVSHAYKPLGHLVYQGTSLLSPIQDDDVKNHIQFLIHKMLLHQPLLCAVFQSVEEDEMKEYILFPEKRISIAREVFVVESIEEIWKFSKDKHFLAIHLLHDSKLGMRNFLMDEVNTSSAYDLLSQSDILIGILFRKAACGMKAVLKMYKSAGIEKEDNRITSLQLLNADRENSIDQAIEKFSGKNIQTLSMRIELYVKENQWKQSNHFTREFLYTFICNVEALFANAIFKWNEKRYQCLQLEQSNRLSQYLKENPYYILSQSKEHSGKSYSTDEIFNLRKDYLMLHDNQSYLTHDGLKTKLINGNLFAEQLSLISNLKLNPLPFYILSTRDCFVFDLLCKQEDLILNHRNVIKKEYFFHSSSFPKNFKLYQTHESDFRVGITTYENFFTHEELQDIERSIELTEDYSLKDCYLPETAQKTFMGDKIKRTKFFFGFRYMRSQKHLAEPNSFVAAGIRKDVSPPPKWMIEKVEKPLVGVGIIRDNFINSYALNVYHDGSEGLSQHFDDAIRFKQPIYTLRTFSDSRLSFGSQLYGFCNGAFTIPLPRGCICIMEENSYASNGVKHCIRPCDMTGKSAALILRQMHPDKVAEAEKYDLQVEFPSWFSSLSIHPDSVSYTKQKEMI